jgi:uncharacterized protein (TIGR00251 family)
MAKIRGLPSADAIRALADGEGRLAIRVTPNAGAAKIMLPEAGGALQVRITEPPEDGKANAAVLRLLGKALGVPKSGLEILSGHQGRNKLVRIAS